MSETEIPRRTGLEKKFSQGMDISSFIKNGTDLLVDAGMDTVAHLPALAYWLFDVQKRVGGFIESHDVSPAS